jgi:hypothetical protein
MRSSSWWAVAAGAALLMPAYLAPPRARAPVGKAAERRTIALSSVYSTNGQEGLKGAPLDLTKEARRSFESLRRKSLDAPSNIFLVTGRDIAEAIAATRLAMSGARPVDGPVKPKDDAKVEKHWLVVFLGHKGSEPPAWLVKSVEQADGTIRATISEPKGGGRTADLHEYLIWAPVGKLKAGTWTLELYMAEKKRVTLLRRVDVPPGSE